jgi:endoglucanase
MGLSRLPDSNPARASRSHIRLIRELTEAAAVSGDERSVRKLVRRRVEPIADDIHTDAMGNLLVTRRGTGRRRIRVMLAAHMDEVGFMIVAVNKEGLLRFEAVGGLDPRQVLGKPVWVGEDRINGVIGGKPVHLATADELKQTVKVESLAIDIGATSKDSAQAKVKPGDWATFATRFSRVRSTIRGKALDDRLGVAALIELLEHPPDNVEILGAFTVQEEVGLRGAGIAARKLKPDVAIALDCTPARDLPTWDGRENTQYNAVLRGGPAIYAADSRTIAHPALLRHFTETAEKLGIPYQIRQPGGGGTDSGAMQLANEGIPAISISTPARYIHTAAALADLADWRGTVILVHAAVSSLRPSDLRR